MLLLQSQKVNCRKQDNKHLITTNIFQTEKEKPKKRDTTLAIDMWRKITLHPFRMTL